MKSNLLLMSVFVIVMNIVAGCANALRIDGPYEGRIIDADTGQPLEGVVVLGVWNKEMATVAGAVSSYYDATETLTNSNGDFRIDGQGMLIASNVLPVSVLMFKAGYHYESGLWSSLKKYAKNITWKGEKATIPLKKLTMGERKMSTTFPPSPSTQIPPEKIQVMLKEIQKERQERALD